MDIIATTAFGIESVTALEVRDLGFENVRVENGKVLFSGNERDIARANMWLRTSDRVLLSLAEFKAFSFEDLFQGVYAVPWADILPLNANIHVLGKSVNSTLHSVPDCQSITKKAIIEKLKQTYHQDVFDESGTEYRIAVSILKDTVTITMDTSGIGLHKRGYRSLAGEAPIKETLACALLLLSYWKGNRTLVDPLCGSGTIPIEAAMIATNRAPGLKRYFACESWSDAFNDAWASVREEANDLFNPEADVDISGSDIDPKAIDLALIHAEESGMDEFIRLKQMNVADLASKKQYGFIVTNPPYAERLGEAKEVEALYKTMGETFLKLDTWSYYIITPFPAFEKIFGKQADKRRKLFNGRIECQYFQFYGPKPPKRDKE